MESHRVCPLVAGVLVKVNPGATSHETSWAGEVGGPRGCPQEEEASQVK